jgi:tetratricopeptide (TPR) repeat protein
MNMKALFPLNTCNNYLPIWVSSILLLILLPSLALANLSAEDYYQKGVRSSHSKDWGTAAESFLKAIQLQPKHKLAHANLGVALSQKGMHKDALLAFEKALSLGYDNAFMRYNRGLSFARLNLLEEAVTEMEKALKMNPRMVKTNYDLGHLYNKMGRREDALQQAEKLFRRNRKLSKKLYDQIPPDYTIVSVNNSGTLKGKVTLTGPIPKVRSFHMIHAPNIEYCGRMSDGQGHRLLHDFTVADDGGLKDTVIAIQGLNKGKPFKPQIQTLNISLCHSEKYVIGVRNSEDILIQNTDPIRHEIATYEMGASLANQITNKPVDAKTSQVRSAYVAKDVNQFVMKCNLHPFLQTRGFLVDNPYYTVTDKDGSFSIEGIPPGTYDVVAWHPFIPTRKGTVKIDAEGEATINFEFNGKDQRRKLYHDDLDGYRFQTWYDSFENFYGGSRVDDPVEILQSFDANGENIILKKQ